MKEVEKLVTLVLVSHRSSNKIIKILKSLKNFKNIIIIENSKNKSLKYIKKNKKIRLFFTNNNGYGAAINYASKFVKTKFFLAMNPDIKNINDRLIKNIFKESNKIKDNFLCTGPRFLGVSNKSHKQSDIQKKISKIFAISGACMFFNKKNFDQLNGFDEKFFLFFEENDICLRGNKLGLYSYQINNVKINHETASSVEIKNEKEKKKYEKLRDINFLKSKIYFYKKHYGVISTLVYFVALLIRIKLKNMIFLTRNNVNYKKNKLRISLISSNLFKA